MNWIKVTDELPIDFMECWVYTLSMQEPELSIFWEGEFYYNNDEFSGAYKNITHWQRLIAPPIPEEE